MKTNLVFGCTGMLAGAMQALSSSSTNLVSFSRGRKRVSGVENVIDCHVDFGETNAFQKIQTSLNGLEGVHNALIWIHPEHETLVYALLSHLEGRCDGTVVQVFGTYDPASHFTPDRFSASYNGRLKYCWVKLGRMGTRWLTDEEISNGAIAALNSTQNTIVGQLPSH